MILSDARTTMPQATVATLTSPHGRFNCKRDPSSRLSFGSSVLVALILLATGCLYAPPSLGQPDKVTIHEDGHEVTFHTDGTFVATCRCVSWEFSALCIKPIRVIGILLRADKDIGVEQWDLHGTMKSGSRIDLRQVCYLHDRKQEVPVCCTKGEESDFESEIGYYNAKLKSTESE